jgi:hypothetical protein
MPITPAQKVDIGGSWFEARQDKNVSKTSSELTSQGWSFTLNNRACMAKKIAVQSGPKQDM